MQQPLTYLDNNASTRPDPCVLEAMRPYFEELYGNPSSMHHFGAQVLAAIEEARLNVARRINARDTELVFCSGGTEANNAAIRGVLAARPNRRHVIVSAVEHSAVLQPAEQLEREGIAVTRIGVDRSGRLRLDELASSLRDDTAVVSIMLANNETGVIHPIREAAAVAHARGVPLHTDAVQAVGKIAVDVRALDVDLLSLSGHKLHGPKGIGALFVRRGAAWRPFIIGGPQERDRRGGTHNAPAIIGLGAACEHAAALAPQASTRIAALRDRLESSIVAASARARVIGGEMERLPNTSCICFEGVEAEAVVLLLSEAGVCVSSGAACSSGSLEPSHVLQAMGIDPQIAQGQVRFSLSHETDDGDIDRVLEVLPGILERVGGVNVV